MRVRTATGADLDALAQLRQELLEETFTRPYDPPTWVERKPIFERALNEGLVVVAEEDDRLVGFALGEMVRPGVGVLVFLHVRADARRLGVAKGLTAELLELLASRGAAWIHLEVEDDNSVARAVYQRWGFSPCSSLLIAGVDELRSRL